MNKETSNKYIGYCVIVANNNIDNDKPETHHFYRNEQGEYHIKSTKYGHIDDKNITQYTHGNFLSKSVKQYIITLVIENFFSLPETPSKNPLKLYMKGFRHNGKIIDHLTDFKLGTYFSSNVWSTSSYEFFINTDDIMYIRHKEDVRKYSSYYLFEEDFKIYSYGAETILEFYKKTFVTTGSNSNELLDDTEAFLH